MINNNLRKEIEKYKKSTGYDESTIEQREAIAEDLIKKMKCFEHLDNNRLMHSLYEIRRGKYE